MDEPHFKIPDPSLQNPTPQTPPQAQPTIEPTNESKVQKVLGKIKQLFSGSKLKYLLIIPIIVLLALLIFGYMVIAKGQTKLGEKLQDEIWQSVIANTTTESKSMDISITYTDSGSYKFVPSNFMKSFGEAYRTEDLSEIDQKYTFTISDVRANGRLKAAFDFSDKDKPKVDGHIEGALSNNGKSFESSADLKLDSEDVYTKYDYNSNVEDLSNYIFGNDSYTTENKNRWEQLGKEYGLDSIRDSIKTIAQLKDFGSNSADAKRLADIRQIASALELYYNDNNSYPESENGKPKGIQPTYIGTIPIAPTPPDGDCSEDMNNYKYEAAKKGSGAIQEYLLTFCVGSQTGGLKAGNLKLTQAGIDSYDCPASRQCNSENKTSEEAKQTKLQELLAKHRLFDIKSFKGVGIMDGTPVVHYELSLNKDQLREFVSITLNSTFEGSNSNEFKSMIEEVTNELITKINVNNYDVWVGITNQKLYKSKMSIDALSITKAVDHFEKSLNDPDNPITEKLNGQLDSAKSKSKDAKRLADIRQMASALELYFNDNNAYPSANNGLPVGIVPTYISELPVAPSPDGSCSEYDNTYWYTNVSPNSYKFMFCLGSETGGIKGGIATMSQSGIEGSGTYVDDNYYNGSDSELDVFESFKSTVINTIRDLTFDAKLEIEYQADNVGDKLQITPPDDFIPAKSY